MIFTAQIMHEEFARGREVAQRVETIINYFDHCYTITMVKIL